MDVGAWLKSLGLERYEAAFCENDVTAALLPNLTADDLKDLGVTLVGHRRQLLDAIAELRPKSGPSVFPVPFSPEPLTSPAQNFGPPETTAERRPLSVMFCDLIGSTAPSRPGSIPRTCARSSAATKRASPAPSNGSTASLPAMSVT